MWRSIEIRNFRSIKRVQATLAPFTVVVGPNSSGKSNFVDAFVFARDVAIDASQGIQSRGGIASIRRWNAARSLDVTIDVRVARRREQLESNYVRHAFTLASRKGGQWSFAHELIEVHPRNSTSLHLERDQENNVVIDAPRQPGGRRGRPAHVLESTASAMPIALQHPALPPHIDFLDVRRFRFDTDAMRRPQLVTERTQLDETGSNLAAAVQAVRTTTDWAMILAAMKKIIPGLTRIEEGALGRYINLRFFQARMGGAEAEFTATEMSEGAIRALAILVAARQKRPDELMIFEEPEVSIHPGAANVLFESLKAASHSGNILLTTHSPELLDAADTEEILVCDYRKGVTEVGPLDDRQRDLVRDGLFSISEIMRSEPLRIQGARPESVEET